MEVILDDCCAYFPNLDTMVASDLHLGLKKQDSAYPKMEHEEILERLLTLTSKHAPSELIFNGDVFNQQYMDQSSVEIFESIDDRVEDIVFIRGNHEEKRDGYPDYIRENYRIEESYEKSGVSFHHGHERMGDNSDIQVIGHEHPIRNGEDVYILHRSLDGSEKILILPKFSNIVGGLETEKRSTNSGSPAVDEHYINDFSILTEGSHNIDLSD